MIQLVDGVLYGADAQVIRWIAERIEGYRGSPDAHALGVVRGDKLVAAVTYENCNGVHLESCIAADPGTAWASRRVMRHLFGYPFLQVGVRAISVSAGMDNPASINLAVKMGFTPEALIRYAAPSGADMVVLKMLREDCRWIAPVGSPHIGHAA